jgi:hypothetical protein
MARLTGTGAKPTEGSSTSGILDVVIDEPSRSLDLLERDNREWRGSL